MASSIDFRLVYLLESSKRDVHNTQQEGLGEYIFDFDCAMASKYSKATQDFRDETFFDDFPQIMRDVISGIKSQTDYLFFKDADNFWTVSINFFAGKKELFTFGHRISSSMKILIDSLFDSPMFKKDGNIPEVKKKACKIEAIRQFVGDKDSIPKLVVKRVLACPSPPDKDHLGSCNYYLRHPGGSLKEANQYYWPYWVSVWLVKTCLVSQSAICSLDNFLGNPNVQSFLRPMWLHDAIIVPVEIIVWHLVHKCRAWTGTDKRKLRLTMFLKAVYLEYYLDQIAQLKKLPLPYLDTGTVDEHSKVIVTRLRVDKDNADLVHLIEQQQAAKREAVDYPSPNLSALCILFALKVVKDVDNTKRFKEAIEEKMSAAEGKIDKEADISGLISSFLEPPHPDISLSAFILMKSDPDAKKEAVFHPPSRQKRSVPVLSGTAGGTSKNDDDDDASQEAKKRKLATACKCFVEITSFANQVLSFKSTAKEVMAMKTHILETTDTYKGFLTTLLSDTEDSHDVTFENNKFCHPLLEDTNPIFRSASVEDHSGDDAKGGNDIL
jgi:hypothetical protein